jgi:hypothetical protein
MRCVLAVAIAAALPVQGRISATAVKVPFVDGNFNGYTSNTNSVNGFSGSMDMTYDLSTAQTNGACYGRTTSSGSSDCITLVYDLGATYNIRSVVTYLPSTYSGGLFSSTVSTRFFSSNSEVRVAFVYRMFTCARPSGHALKVLVCILCATDPLPADCIRVFPASPDD